MMRKESTHSSAYFFPGKVQKLDGFCEPLTTRRFCFFPSKSLIPLYTIQNLSQKVSLFFSVCV